MLEPHDTPSSPKPATIPSNRGSQAQFQKLHYAVKIIEHITHYYK